MIAFTPSILEHWKERGYKFIYILALKKYGVMQPLYKEKEMVKGFTICIHEVQLIQMEEIYFFAKEKDVTNLYIRT